MRGWVFIMGVFDIVLLVSIGFFVVMGLGRGFIKEIKPIIVWIGSLVGAKILAYPVSTYMYTSMDIDGKLKSSIGSIVEKLDYSSLNALRSSIEGSLSNIPYVGSLMKGFTENNWDLTEAFTP